MSGIIDKGTMSGGHGDEWRVEGGGGGVADQIIVFCISNMPLVQLGG